MSLHVGIRVWYEFIAYYWRRLKILKLCMPTVLVRPLKYWPQNYLSVGNSIKLPLK